MTLLERANKFLAKRQIETPYDVSHDELPSLLTAFAESVMPKWTYCEDAPPEVYGRYLCSTSKGKVQDLTFANKRWYCDLHNGSMDVIAWQVKPEPAPHRDIPTESQEGGETTTDR